MPVRILARFSLIALLAVVSSDALAGLSCNITKAFDRPEVRNDASFWEEFGKLSEKGQANDANIEELLRKRSIEVRSESPGASAASHAPDRRVSAPKYTLDKQAQKDIAILPANLRADLDEFLEAAKGGRASLQTLRAQQGRWQLKQLNGGIGYSVRLSGAYRVGFRIMDDDSIRVIAVNKAFSH